MVGRDAVSSACVNGWVSVELENAVELFKLSYERAQVAQAVREARG